MSAKVLLVDDSSTALLLEETVLKKHSAYEVVTARDGEEAVLKAVTEKPDLILMDVVMAKMDWFIACREIRKQEGQQQRFAGLRSFRAGHRITPLGLNAVGNALGTLSLWRTANLMGTSPERWCVRNYRQPRILISARTPARMLNI
jgi:CheY-like chemotaxis protein